MLKDFLSQQVSTNATSLEHRVKTCLKFSFSGVDQTQWSKAARVHKMSEVDMNAPAVQRNNIRVKATTPGAYSCQHVSESAKLTTLHNVGKARIRHVLNLVSRQVHRS